MQSKFSKKHLARVIINIRTIKAYVARIAGDTSFYGSISKCPVAKPQARLIGSAAAKSKAA